jgi:hypothetical protein
MSAKVNPKRDILVLILKIILFVFALYFAFRILRFLLTFILGISFAIIKILVFVACAILVIYFLFRLIFGFDMLKMFGIRRLR